MIRAIVQGDLNVNNGVSSQNAGLHCALNTGVNSGDILLGDGAANNGIDELVTLAGLVGLHMNLYMTILALTAGLTGILGLLIHSLADGLLVGNLRSTDVGLHLELTEQTVNNDLQVQLAHAGDDGLPGFLVGVGPEGGVFFGQLAQSNAHLLLTGLGLGLDSNLDNRLGEDHGLQDDGMVLITEGVAGGGVLHTDSSGDIAGVNHVDIFPVVGVHLQDPTQTLLGALGAVQNRAALFQSTGVHTEVAQLTNIGVGSNLERQGGEGGFIGSGTEVLFLGLGVDALDALLIQRAGHIVNNSVQNFLNTLVLVRGTADHGHHLVGNCRLTDDSLDLGNGDFLTLQVLHGQVIIQSGDGIQQFLVVLVGQVHHVLGDVFHTDILTQLIIEDICLHGQQVDIALEESLGADGQLNGHSIALQTLVDHGQNSVEVGTHDVHLVDIDHPGDLVLIGLTPNGLSLGLNAALGAQNGNSTVQNTQGALHLYGEVHVARGINDVQAAALPEAGSSSGSDGDTALLLLGHPVHGSGAVVGLTDLVVAAGVEQDTLGRGGFTGIDVGHDAEVSGIFQGILSRHEFSP